MIPHHAFEKNTTRLGIFAAAALIATLLIWLPFGFHMTGLIEEWDLLSLFTRFGTFFFAGETSPLASHRLRPLTAMPNAVAYLLTRDSFLGAHWIQIVALAIKGICLSSLAWTFTRSRGLALLAGFLCLLFPADTMQLSLRSLHINVAVALALLAVTCQFHCYLARPGRTSALLAAVAAVSLVVAGMIYEVALLYIPVPLLLLLARLGVREALTVLRTRLKPSLSWIAAAGVGLAYIFYVLKSGQNYQVSVVGQQSVTASVVMERLLQLVNVGLARALFGGWIDAAAILLTEYRSYWYLGLATALLAGILFVCEFRGNVAGGIHADRAQASTGLLLRLLLVGILVAALGYLPFLTSLAHVAISQRTYLFATLGAVLFSLAIIALLSKASRAVAFASCVVLIGLGLAQQLFQFHAYENISAMQRRLLASIVAQTPSPEPGKSLVVLDDSERLSHSWMLRDNLLHALTYLYGKPVNSVFVCSPSSTWQGLDASGRTGTCEHAGGVWTFTPAHPIASFPQVGAPAQPTAVSDANAVVVRLGSEGQVPTDVMRQPATLARARWLATADTVSAVRYRNILTAPAWPLLVNQFIDQAPRARYRWDFGRWWSLESPTPGVGWKEAQWDVEGVERISSAWMSLESAHLAFDLAPKNTPYVIRGRLAQVAPGVPIDAFSVSINGHALPLAWRGQEEFQAIVPAGLLLRGRNMLQFDAPNNPDFYDYSVRMDWVRLAPASACTERAPTDPQHCSGLRAYLSRNR